MPAKASNRTENSSQYWMLDRNSPSASETLFPAGRPSRVVWETPAGADLLGGRMLRGCELGEGLELERICLVTQRCCNTAKGSWSLGFIENEQREGFA